MRSQKLMELQHQKEIIEQWLQTPGIPTDAHARLLDMLSEVNAEMRTNRFVTSNPESRWCTPLADLMIKRAVAANRNRSNKVRA